MTQLGIIHLSDQHLEDAVQPVTVHDGHALADTIFEYEDPDTTVICDTGDFTGSGLQIQYDVAREVMARYRHRGYDYFVSPSNHDLGPAGGMIADYALANFHRFVSEVSPAHDPSRPYPHLYERDGLAVIVANTLAEQTFFARGILGARQRRRLRSQLRHAHRRGLHTCLLLHHCPTIDHPLYRLVDRAELASDLQRAGGVDLMLTGHLHRAASRRDRFGARLLLASPAVTIRRRYRRIWFDGTQFRWQWVYFDGRRG